MTQMLDLSELPPGSDAQTFRDGMSRVGAAVHIITTGGAAGRAGFTATAVSSVSDDPPTVLVCLNRNGRSAAVLARTACSASTRWPPSISRWPTCSPAAAASPARSASCMARGTNCVTGAPVLAGALVAFDCRVIDFRPVATHQILIGQVEAVQLGPARPALLYADRAYREL